MLKLREDILINESQIVTAEFSSESKTLMLVFSVPVSFAQQSGGASNQVELSGTEAEKLWRILSSGAKVVNPALPKPGGGPRYAVAGKRNMPKLI